MKKGQIAKKNYHLSLPRACPHHPPSTPAPPSRVLARPRYADGRASLPSSRWLRSAVVSDLAERDDRRGSSPPASPCRSPRRCCARPATSLAPCASPLERPCQPSRPRHRGCHPRRSSCCRTHSSARADRRADVLAARFCSSAHRPRDKRPWQLSGEGDEKK